MDYGIVSLRKADTSKMCICFTLVSQISLKVQIQVTRRDEENAHLPCRILFSLHAINMSGIIHNNSGVKLHEKTRNQIAYEELQDCLQRD